MDFRNPEEFIPPRTGARFIPENTDAALPPPAQPARARPPVIDVPILPDVIIAPRSTRSETAITPPPRQQASAQQPPRVVFTPARAIENTQTGPEYPTISRRLSEQGTVRLRLTIGIDGGVIAAEIAESSGFERLDRTAVDWVLRNWRYEPARRGNVPVQSTAEAELTFELH
jgi:protein TonB